MARKLKTYILSLVKQFKYKQLTPEEAINKYIKPGDRVFIDSGYSEPLDLTQKLIELSPTLPDVELIHFSSLSNLDYYKTASYN